MATYTLIKHGLVRTDSGGLIGGNAELYEIDWTTGIATGAPLATAALGLTTGIWSITYASADTAKNYTVVITPSTVGSTQRRYVLMTNEQTANQLVVIGTSTLLGNASVGKGLSVASGLNVGAGVVGAGVGQIYVSDEGLIGVDASDANITFKVRATTSLVTVKNADLQVDNALYVAADSDKTMTLGRAVVGGISDIAVFGHVDVAADVNAVAVRQTSAGMTRINAKTGSLVAIGVNAVTHLEVSDAGVVVKGVNFTATGNAAVYGNLAVSGAITLRGDGYGVTTGSVYIDSGKFVGVDEEHTRLVFGDSVEVIGLGVTVAENGVVGFDGSARTTYLRSTTLDGVVEMQGYVQGTCMVRISSASVLLGAVPTCSLYNTGGDVTISNATDTALAFTGEYIDNDTMHDNVTNNTRITFTKAGKYLVGGSSGFAPNTTGTRMLTIRKGGTTTLAFGSSPATPTMSAGVSVSHLLSANAGDYVELLAYQSSGGNLACQAIRFWATRVSG